jgi:hypothetical protein
MSKVAAITFSITDMLRRKPDVLEEEFELLHSTSLGWVFPRVLTSVNQAGESEKRKLP